MGSVGVTVVGAGVYGTSESGGGRGAAAMTVGEATVGVCWCMVESVCIVGFCICDEVEMKKHSGMNTFSFVIGRHSIFVTWEDLL